jgi:hypothetical protein
MSLIKSKTKLRAKGNISKGEEQPLTQTHIPQMMNR